MTGPSDARTGSVAARWMLAFRLARREFRRHPWRHALVVLMIAVPVLAAMVAFSAIPTAQANGDARRSFAAQGADLVNHVGSFVDDPSSEKFIAALPPGSEHEIVRRSHDLFVSDRQRPDGLGSMVIGTEITEVATKGEVARFRVDAGRLPGDDTEIFLTSALADIGGWTVGDRIASGRDDREFVITGVGAARDGLDREMAVVTGLPDSYWTSTLPGLDQFVLGDPTEGDPRTGEGLSIGSLHVDQRVLAWLPTDADVAAVQELGGVEGFYVDVVHSPSVRGLLIPGMALVFGALSAIVAIVSSAAFAIASRRQLRSVGLLATAGADPATIRSALVMQGAFPGLVAAGSSLAIVLLGSRLIDGLDVLPSLTAVDGATTVLSPGGITLAMVLGVLAGTGAAWLPARAASKVPVLSALAGRRPVGPVPTRTPFTGLFFVGAGAVGLALLVRQVTSRSGNGAPGAIDTATPLLMIGTVLAMLFGLVALAPTLVEAAGSLSTKVTGTTRIALRGLARQRGQSAAAVAAVAICLAVPVGVLTTKASLDFEDRYLYEVESSSTDPSGGYHDAGDPRPEPTSVRSTPGAMTVQVHGDLSSPGVDDLVSKVEAITGPLARVPFLVFADGAGGWYSVAAISPDHAAQNLAPWAAQQLLRGGAVALLGEPGTLLLDDGVTGVTLDAIGHPDGDLARLTPDLDADYLVPDTVLQQVAIGRPPLNLALMAPEQLTVDQASEIDSIGNPADLYREWFHQPTVIELREARAAAQTGTAGPQGRGGESDGLAPDLTLSLDWSSVEGGSQSLSAPDPPLPSPHDPDRTFRRWLTVLAAVSGALSLLVLTITLSLRAVDSVDDHRAAVAAGAAPARMRRQHALEGAILASLGALLALPLGWLPVTAVRFGQVRDHVQPGRGSTVDAVTDRLHVPGWEIVPILVLPIFAVWLLWLVAPWLRSLARRGPVDQVLPRY